MTAVLLGQHEPNTPEWDALRSRGLGGSEIAAVVGLSPWVSRFALYHRKRGTLGKQDVNAGMSWGTRLERVVTDAFLEFHPEWFEDELGMFHHADRPWQIANPDAVIARKSDVRTRALLEVKTAHQYDAHEWGYGPEDIPPYYRCQVLWYMDVLGVLEAHLAVLIGGSDYREYVIPYVADEAEWLRAEGEAFWQDVLDGNPPPLDGSDATYEAVRKLHPEINGEDVEIDPTLYAAYCASKDLAEKYAERHKRHKAMVLDLMGQAKRALVDGTPVLRRQPGRGGSVSLQPIPQPKHETTTPEGDAA